MSLTGRISQIKSHIVDALDDYAEDLEQKQKDGVNGHIMFGVLQGSIKTRSMGRFSRKIGIDVGYVMANQWNTYPIDYASLFIGGHRESPWVPFNDGTIRKFPATDGNPFIVDALNSMPRFASYYKPI